MKYYSEIKINLIKRTINACNNIVEIQHNYAEIIRIYDFTFENIEHVN